MRMIKVGTRYLALVDNQRDALRFTGGRDETLVIAAAITSNTGLSARAVKLTTRADRTADSMQALASDVLGDDPHHD